jgi:hypothetical protein
MVRSISASGSSPTLEAYPQPMLVVLREREVLASLTPSGRRAELLHVLMLPDFERATGSGRTNPERSLEERWRSGNRGG